MRTNKIVLGLFLILVGIVMGTNSLQITNINLFFSGWWTLFIIVPSLYNLLKVNNPEKVNSLIGLIIGICLLLLSRGIFSLDLILTLIVPFIFVAIGVSIIFNDSIKTKVTEKMKNFENKDGNYIVATFSEQKMNYDEEEFEGVNLEAIFGSVELDLTKTKLKKESCIKSSSIFGSVKVIIPKDVNVKVKSTAIFGGVTNKNINSEANKKTIYVESFCLFGGLELR